MADEAEEPIEEPIEEHVHGPECFSGGAIFGLTEYQARVVSCATARWLNEKKIEGFQEPDYDPAAWEERLELCGGYEALKEATETMLAMAMTHHNIQRARKANEN